MADKPILNADQKIAFKALQKFIDHPTANTFVLKGYAGTGKTFLMQYLGKWLESNNHSFCMLASTGRAASVLRGKTGFDAKTVHSEVYNFSKVNGADGGQAESASATYSNQMSLQFTVRVPDENQVLYIVDEASMLSGEASTDSSFATFGTGNLLNDLFMAAGKNKIVFVGDPCQLPPVKQVTSPALDTDWLAAKERVAISFTLEKIERTSSDNDILKLAGLVRTLGQQKTFERFIRLPANNLNHVRLHSSEEELFKSYQKKYRTEGANGALAIARSNKTVQNINMAMRRDLFGKLHMPMQLGDVLLVTQNNYAVPLTNGDFVTVCDIGGISSKEDLRFQRITVKAVTTGLEYTLLLSLDVLNSITGNLDEDQSHLLMMDFNHRMRRKNVSPNTPEYRKAMMADEYLSCLKATFGYAVTCHKSQGGEWNNVFLFLDKSMYGMPAPELCKWWYTAITRTKQELNLVKDWWVR
ncbi:ATP-dependent DNA helicase [Mucilaginibacter polytrichastri]|uniref:UvrD-like helicase C-terminal domain-containing protein n=1 Tax=Mucilaginibacter polytrichastri TaxID=1302689 RepID=A0A1Q6A1D3_9SPHI|nr:DEAD/DEAH box helicase [Mucilaginibacter polytrichastri]OKS87829.1 hypothetical protein RG47T_3292 [Mucilaginibacter polytrichastri]SFT25933.1 UvrD-like helicase C-terminal domain-containing protein [Mucilaginibacter polytrichastri]